MDSFSPVPPRPPGVMAVLTGTRHTVVRVSEPFCAFTGYAREEEVGRGH